MGTASYIEEVRQKMMVWGQAPDPFACWLLERGLKTIDVRVRRQNENAMRIATWGDEPQGDSKRVHYPGPADSPRPRDRRRRSWTASAGCSRSSSPAAARPSTGSSAVSTCGTHAPSLGGVDSLVSEPRYTSHATCRPEERARIGIPDGFLRLSVGIEDADDLIADLEQAVR